VSENNLKEFTKKIAGREKPENNHAASFLSIKMNSNIVKIGIEGLDIGMFVTDLDRPWKETSFLFQGMKVTSREELQELQALCSHVYVDTSRGLTPAPEFWRFHEDVDPKRRASLRGKADFLPNELSNLRQVTYENSTKLEDEIKVAEKGYDSIKSNFELIQRDLQKGKNIDIDSVKQSVEIMVESILRNPSAFMLVKKLRDRDEYSYSHALGTSVWCATLGRHLGLERIDIDSLALGGMLLDIGKNKVPPELVSKKEPLNPQEMELMRNHVDMGVRLLVGNDEIPHEVFRMVATHHERADGSGYPLGLMNNEISVFGRIAGLADSYDAMTTQKSYRPNTLSPHDAINELHSLKSTKFQPELVEQFIQAVGLYPSGSLVELNTGEVAVIIEINSMRRLRPTIMVLLDEKKRPYEDFRLVDLSESEENLQVVNSLPMNAYGINVKELFL
jgi:HD-GYP domain-containing protein (c-di-GMP phosphodiesterase class II)